jgi:S-methylmethionine-dependent homocysteine/selenocysteine methylase
MDKVAWSGAAVFTDPDSVRETHEDYIRAGARVIITNTFGSTRQILDALIPMGPSVVNIMHSEIGAIPEAIELVRQRWSGPIGVYPESGYFTKPHWNFVDVIPPAELVTEALGWIAQGVRLLGGCCGTNPDHIKALQAAMPELQAARNA